MSLAAEHTQCFFFYYWISAPVRERRSLLQLVLLNTKLFVIFSPCQTNHALMCLLLILLRMMKEMTLLTCTWITNILLCNPSLASSRSVSLFVDQCLAVSGVRCHPACCHVTVCMEPGGHIGKHCWERGGQVTGFSGRLSSFAKLKSNQI